MTERSWPDGCRRLAVVALVAFCLKQGVDGAWAYLGSADAYSYLADWRAAARHAPDGAIALLCGDAGRISPVERSRLIAISWERAPDPLLALAASNDLRSVNCVLTSRWLPSSAAEKLKAGGFSFAAANEHVKTWVRDGAVRRAPRRRTAEVPALRESTALLAVLALMVMWFAWTSGLQGLGKGSVLAAVSVAAVLGAVALSHPLLAPNGLGTYGGKAKLLFECGGLPEAFLNSSGGKVLQPSYPPGLTALALLHFALSGGCGDRLVQLIVVFAMALLCLGLLRRPASQWSAVPVALYCLSPVATRMDSGFSAEPLAALALLQGWSMVVRGKPRAGALVTGLAGLFRPEAGVVAAVFVAGACASVRCFRKMPLAVLLSVVPSVAWLVACQILGYGSLPDWDVGAMPKFGQVGYAAWGEAKALAAFVLPVATVACLVRPRLRPVFGGRIAVAFASAALLLLAFPLACAFYSSPSASWMVDNTMFRLVWYVSVVPLFEISLEPERRFQAPKNPVLKPYKIVRLL